MTALLIYTAIVAALALSTMRHPPTAIAGVICMYGLEQWAQGSHPLFLQYPALTNYVIGFIVLLGLAKKIYRGQPILRGYPAVGLLVFTLFLYALVSTLWAPNPERSLDTWLEHVPYTVTIIILSPLLCSNTGDVSRAFVATLALGTVLLFLLMFTVQWEFRSVVFPGEKYNSNPGAIGSLGATICLFAAYFTWDRAKLSNILKWVIVALGLLLAVRSGSRGQTLAAIAVLIAFWPIGYRLHSLKAYAIFASTIVFIALATFWGLDMFWADSGRWSGDSLQGATDGRVRRSSNIFAHWFTTPATIFFGLGNSASRDVYGTYAHVLAVDILCEEGIVGFVMFLSIAWSCLRNGFTSFFLVRQDPKQRVLLVILSAVLSYYFLLSLKQGNLLGSPLLFMLAILMAKYRKFVLNDYWYSGLTQRSYSIGSTRS